MSIKYPLVSALAVVALAATAQPAAAAEDAPPLDPSIEGTGKILEETAQQFMEMLGTLLGSIPTYEMPQILDNGDIIIRRKKPENTPTPPSSDSQSMTRT